MKFQPLLIRDVCVYTPQGPRTGHDMLVGTEGNVLAIGSGLQPPSEALVLHLPGYSVLPGLIDLHLHGGMGASIMDATRESIETISRFHAAHGTTAFLATTCSPTAKLGEALACAAAAVHSGLPGAQVVGIHMEGPFLAPDRKGAFDTSDLFAPSEEQIEAYWEVAKGSIRMVTLAPELPGAMEAVKMFVQKGAAVSLGHTNATWEQSVRAVQNGATRTTHHFNAMSPFTHREPGMAGAGLVMDELDCEVICDGLHVHPAAVQLLYKAKGPEHTCLVTDAVFSAGLPDGEYGRYEVRSGVTYLAGTDTLAGSRLTMLDALKNLMAFTGEPLETVLPAATSTPAAAIGVGNRKGRLAPGMDADFLVLDGQLGLCATYCGGTLVHKTEQWDALLKGSGQGGN